MLGVWADSETASELSATIPLPVSPLLDLDRVFAFMRDLPYYEIDLLGENLIHLRH